MTNESKNKIDHFIDSASNYVEKNGGARLYWGIGLIAVIQLIFGLSWIDSKTNERAVALAAVETEVITNRALVEDNEIAIKLKSTEELVAQFRRKVYSAPTTGLLAADIEAFITQKSDKVGLKRVQTSVNFEKTVRDDIVRFVIDINAQENKEGDFSFFLSDILRSERAFKVTSLDWNRNNKRLNLSLECLGRIVEAES